MLWRFQWKVPVLNRCALKDPGGVSAFTERLAMYPAKGKLPERAWKRPGECIFSGMDRSRRNAIVYGIIVSWMGFPIVCVLIAAVVSAVCGCSITESSSTPWIFFGTDIG